MHVFMHGGHGGRRRPARRPAMSNGAPAYGLWSLVIINSAIFIFFAFSFFKPKTKRDWRSFGAFSAFLNRAVYGDVRLPAYDLFPLGVAAGQLSRGELVLTRCRPPPGDAVRLEDKSAFRPVPPFEHRLHRRRLHPDLDRLARALPGTAAGRAGDDRTVRPSSATRNMSASSWSCSAFCCNGRRF